MARPSIKGLGVKERLILSSLLRAGHLTVRANDITNHFGTSRKIAHLILSRLSKKGWLQRLKPGVYGFVPLSSDFPEPVPEDSWALAMELFSPCYISGWSAAEHWDLTEQIFNTIVVFTSQPQRNKMHKIAGISYRTRHISQKEIFGTKKLWSKNVPILVADIHRTIIDILNSPELGAGGRNMLDMARTYFKSDAANPEILLSYAKQLSRGTLFKRLGFIFELCEVGSGKLLEECKSRITAGISKLDPTGPDKGKIVTKWRLRINIPTEEFE